jgi:putative ABC transport system permease protein
VPFGIAMGAGMTHVYREFFRFPDLTFRTEPAVVLLAVAISFAAALLGGWAPARRIARMAPAQALQPPTPPAFQRGWLERSGIARRLPPSLRLVARNVVARPTRTLAAVSGVAAALGILVVGSFWRDSFVELLHHQFRMVQHEDATIALTGPASARAVRELAQLPGVRLAEGLRTVPVRLRTSHTSERSALLGLPPGVSLRRLIDRDGRTVSMPREGLVLSKHLADVLDVGRGARLTAEVLEGERRQLPLTVALVVDEPLGMSAYVDAGYLSALMGEGPAVSAVLLSIERGREREAHEALRGVPGVASVSLRDATLDRFEGSMMEIVLIFSVVLTLLSGLVVVGVVYNTTRILVAERERELATLRVLGFTRGDISESVLLELAVQVLPALGVGAAFGWSLSAIAVRLFGPEDLTIPLVIGARTWVFCLSVVLVAAVLSALAARRRLDRIDLVSVLKVRE